MAIKNTGIEEAREQLNLIQSQGTHVWVFVDAKKSWVL